MTVEKVEVNTGDAIYLTFDDGPSSDVTVRILDTLKANGIKATFFICDYDEDKLPIIKRMIDEGHVLGNHSVTHPSAGMPSLSLDKQENEVTENHAWKISIS